MAFQDSTRRKHIKLGLTAKGSVNPLTWDIPKVGLLAGIFIDIRGTLTGTITAPNALGKACIIRRIRLSANSGIDLINISGAGYHYLLRDHIEDYKDPVPFTDARSVVAAGAYTLSVFLPVALNSRDPLGLFMLQNEQTLLQLSVEFESDANIATGITAHTANVQPTVEYFSVPQDQKNWPALNLAQVIIEDTRSISGAGDFEYRWPRGNTYIQTLHGCGINQAPADTFSAVKVKVNQSDHLWDATNQSLDLEFARSHGRARLLGVIPIDFIGTSGLGCFGSPRDLLNSQAVTELLTVITATGAATLYTVRRQFVTLA